MDTQTIPHGKRLLHLDAGRTSDVVEQQIRARDLPAVLLRMAIDESDTGRTDSWSVACLLKPRHSVSMPTAMHGQRGPNQIVRLRRLAQAPGRLPTRLSAGEGLIYASRLVFSQRVPKSIPHAE